MRLLLTSAGITNPSIKAALIDLLAKPIAESRALLITTASYPLSAGAELAWNFLAGRDSVQGAIRAYVDDVRARRFPGPEHCYGAIKRA